MRGINKVIILGRLGKNPELRNTSSGTSVTSISVATNESWLDKQQNKQERTHWHNVVLWDKLAENAYKYLTKGSVIYLEGKLQTRSWEDKEGKKQYATEIVANQMQYVTVAKKDDTKAPVVVPEVVKENEDIPF